MLINSIVHSAKVSPIKGHYQESQWIVPGAEIESVFINLSDVIRNGDGRSEVEPSKAQHESQ